MRGELQAKLDLSIEAAAISKAAQDVAAGHRRPYFWQGFLRGAQWDNKLQPLRRLVRVPSSTASATTSRPSAPLSDKLEFVRAEAFHEAVVLPFSPPFGGRQAYTTGASYSALGACAQDRRQSCELARSLQGQQQVGNGISASCTCRAQGRASFQGLLRPILVSRCKFLPYIT